MKKYGFEIGDTVCLRGCSERYREENKFIVAKRETRCQIIYIDDVPVESRSDVYSNGSDAWYDGNSLINYIKSEI